MRYSIRKISIISILIIFIISLNSCNYNLKKEKGFKIYYNKNTVQEISVIKDLVKKYEEIENRKITIIGLEKEDDIKNFIGEEKEECVVLLDGYSFLDFINNDYIRDIGHLYKEKETRKKFAVMLNSYGMERGVYKGISIMPFSLELIINKDLIKKKGVEIEKNNFTDAILKLKEKGIKVHSYIKSEYTKELLISALIANDTIVYDINENNTTGSLQNKIYSIKNGEKIFENLNRFYKEGSLREENFIDENEGIIEEFNNGKVEALLTTTLSSNKINSNINGLMVNKLQIENEYVDVPVGVDIIITSSIGNTNRAEIDRFFRYLLQSGGIEGLSEEKIITGNKYGDSKLTGIQEAMATSIHGANKINKFYFNIISNEDIEKIEKEVKKVMEGKYDGEEWMRITKKTTPK